MSDEIRVSKWAIGMGVTILLALGTQTFLAARWAGKVSEQLDSMSNSQSAIRRELTDAIVQTENKLTRRIERLEDFDRNRIN